MKPAASKQLPVASLRPAAWNPNRVAEATLAKVRTSIERYGFVENLVVREHPSEKGAYEVLSGNHRLQLVRELGATSIRCVVVDVDDPNARLLAQTLNRTRGRDDPLEYRKLLLDLLAVLPVEDITGMLPESEESLNETLGRLPGGGGGRPIVVADVWSIVIDCEDEEAETALLERFREEGRDCRPLQRPPGGEEGEDS